MTGLGIANLNNGNSIRLYHHDNYGSIVELISNAGSWKIGEKIGFSPQTTDLTVVVSENSQKMRMYYIDMNNNIREAVWEGKVWQAGSILINNLNQQTKLSAVAWGDFSEIRIYYILPDGRLMEKKWNGSWNAPTQITTAKIGSSIAASAWVGNNGANIRVYYQDASNNIREMTCSVNSNTWAQGGFVASAEPNSVISSSCNKSGNVNVSFFNISRLLDSYMWDNGWQYYHTTDADVVTDLASTAQNSTSKNYSVYFGIDFDRKIIMIMAFPSCVKHTESITGGSLSKYSFIMSSDPQLRWRESEVSAPAGASSAKGAFACYTLYDRNDIYCTKSSDGYSWTQANYISLSSDRRPGVIINSDQDKALLSYVSGGDLFTSECDTSAFTSSRIGQKVMANSSFQCLGSPAVGYGNSTYVLAFRGSNNHIILLTRNISASTWYFIDTGLVTNVDPGLAVFGSEVALVYFVGNDLLGIRQNLAQPMDWTGSKRIDVYAALSAPAVIMSDEPGIGIVFGLSIVELGAWVSYVTMDKDFNIIPNTSYRSKYWSYSPTSIYKNPKYFSQPLGQSMSILLDPKLDKWNYHLFGCLNSVNSKFEEHVYRLLMDKNSLRGVDPDYDMSWTQIDRLFKAMTNVARDVAQQGPVQCIMICGDITSDRTDTQRHDMQDTLGILNDYNWLIGLGNHDYKNNVGKFDEKAVNMVSWMFSAMSGQAFSIDMTQYSKLSQNYWDGSGAFVVVRQNFLIFQLQLYPSFEENFEGLGNHINHVDIRRSYDWLESILSQYAVGRYIVLCMHSFNDELYTIDDRLKGIINKYRVSAIFCGHIHQDIGYKGTVGDGTPWFRCGASTYQDFLWLNVDEQSGFMQVNTVLSESDGYYRMQDAYPVSLIRSPYQ